LCKTTSNGIIRLWLFPEFGAELPLDNCTPTIILNNYIYIYIYIYLFIYIHTHTESKSKPNRLNFLFPQNGYNVRIKVFHILNAPPFCDVFISLLKHVFKSKLAARVSDFNRLVAISIYIVSFHWNCNIFFFSSSAFYVSSSSSSVRSLQITLIIIFSFVFQLFWLLSRADWKLLTGVSNNV